jgi:hypothetical protein
MADMMTTLIGFSLGIMEANPIVNLFIQHTSPVFGLCLWKALMLGIGLSFLAFNKTRLVKRLNIWFTGLVIWNLICIFTRTQVLHAAVLR